ncbi:hypothetical protein POM88_016879 [Heracleum sosnowskyi]|uniref:DNA2/NAM7 helicase-like C-terminal domain-containing protein n=1 Tax=Heracleum sosnowskyi TaxID=360622 RepID=A0AAD8ING5_9APIA|nr:hypothetical protein POM88_016879 [Heracleum sosnowskyi]
MASMIRRRDCDEERSTITDKGDIGFIDLRVVMLDCMHVEDENEDEISESLNPNSHYDFKLYRDQGKLFACKGDGARFSAIFGAPLGEKDFTVIFTGIISIDDETVGKKSSWFNRFEASKIVEIIRHLTEKEVSGQDQIAVITPFEEHKLKINKALRSIGIPNIQVGSADQLQSREKHVVVSIARSTMKYNYFDRSNCPGLLCNRRRFNATITAARSLLIVIGNPHIVCKQMKSERDDDSRTMAAYLENSEEAVWLADDANQANMGAVQMGNENEANGMDEMQVQRA